MYSNDPTWWQTLFAASSPLWNLLSALSGGAIAAGAAWRLEARRTRQARDTWLRDERLKVCRQISETLATLSHSAGRTKGLAEDRAKGTAIDEDAFSFMRETYWSSWTTLREQAALADVLGMREVHEIAIRLGDGVNEFVAGTGPDMAPLRADLRVAMGKALGASMPPGPAPPEQSPDSQSD